MVIHTKWRASHWTLHHGREPRAALIKRVSDHNRALALKSQNGLKTVCGLPLPHEAWA